MLLTVSSPHHNDSTHSFDYLTSNDGDDAPKLPDLLVLPTLDDLRCARMATMTPLCAAVAKATWPFVAGTDSHRLFEAIQSVCNQRFRQVKVSPLTYVIKAYDDDLAVRIELVLINDQAHVALFRYGGKDARAYYEFQTTFRAHLVGERLIL